MLDPPPVTFTRHARQAVIPSPDEFMQGIETTCARLSSLALCENSSGEEIRASELFSAEELTQFGDRVRHICESHLGKLRERAPDLRSEHVRELAATPHAKKL